VIPRRDGKMMSKVAMEIEPALTMKFRELQAAD
jgi:hypothetical protein